MEFSDGESETPRARQREGSVAEIAKGRTKMSLTDHEKIELIAEAKVFYLSAPVILPMIERRKREALGRLMQAHKSGRTDTATIVAELSAFTDLESEIKQKEQTYRTLEKQNG